MNAGNQPLCVAAIRSAVILTCAAAAWSLWALSSWLRDAYHAQAWLRERHLDSLIFLADLLAPIGPIPALALGATAGLALAFLPTLLKQPPPGS